MRDFTDFERKAYKVGKWLRMKGWNKLGNFVKNVFSPEAEVVLDPPVPA